MLLTGGSVIARRHMRGLDEVAISRPSWLGGDFWVKGPHMPIR